MNLSSIDWFALIILYNVILLVMLFVIIEYQIQREIRQGEREQ